MKTFTSHPKSLLAAAAGGLMLIGAACGSSALAPDANAGQTTALAPAASADASAPSTSSAGEVQISFNSSNSQAQYLTQEQLAGRNLPNVAVGTTTGISGSVVLTQSGELDASASKLTIDLSSLKSDESKRDNFIQRNTLQTSQYPDAIFTPTGVTGLPSPLPTSGSATYRLAGNLTVHGVTKPVTWAVTADFNGQQVSGKATAPFTITEFGMTIPQAGPVLSVQDAGTLELDFTNAPLASAA
ncbi:MAG: YceI family protein [Chloroflexota bacterium]